MKDTWYFTRPDTRVKIQSTATPDTILTFQQWRQYIRETLNQMQNENV